MNPAWLLMIAPLADAEAYAWPQFRGPNAAGVAHPSCKLADDLLSPGKLRWKTPVPAGHSSPAIVGDRVYLTGARDGKQLVTLALDRATGKILWEREAPYEKLEEVHQIGSQAQPSPAADERRIIAFFGSAGLFCYSPEGEQLWHVKLEPFKNNFGAGSSPLLLGDRVILNQDHDTDSFLTVLDANTGKTVWKTDRSEFPRGYASPVVWSNAGRRQIVVAGTLRIVGYDFETGKEAWTARGVARIVNMTPVVGDDGTLFVACWSPGADAGERIVAPTWDEMLADDANKDGDIQENEIADAQMKQRFNQIDRDKNGKIVKQEFERMRQVFEQARNVMVAIKPGGVGDITESHVLWTQSRFLPYVPSPLYYRDCLFTVKNGGIVASFDPKTGKSYKQGRVSGSANYYSSPVAADGKIVLVSQRGEVSLISAEPQWRELAKLDLNEDTFATPAIVENCVFIRSMEHLHCFGGK